MKTLSLLFLLLSVLLSAAESAFTVSPDSIVCAEGIPFQIRHWSRNWKFLTRSGKSNPFFPGEFGSTEIGRGVVRSGLFRVRQGEFKYLEARDLSVPNRARVELSLSSQDPVETGALVLSARFDNRILKNRPIRINGEEKFFSDTFRPDRKQIWFENRAPSRIEIPLRRGILRLCGNFSGTWNDDRAWGQQSCELRLNFNAPGKTFRKADLLLELHYLPYETRPLDLSSAANMSFRDDLANDRKGGWGDSGPDNDLRMLPLGRQNFSGLLFDITDPLQNNGKSCINLRGQKRPWLPESAEVTTPGAKGNYLYLLNALGWEPAKRTAIGSVTISYSNGKTEKHTLFSGEDTANFWNPRFLKNAFAVWKGENPSAKVGLYATRIALSGNPVKLSFRSAGNAVWMIVGATLADADLIPEESGPVVLSAGNEFIETRQMEPVKKGSLLDFSDLLDAPAGKYGFLRAAGDHFEFEKRPGKPVRFWGVNNSGDANFMSHEESERLADDFASLGYNIIRFAGFDHLLAGTGAASSLDFQTENLDRIDYLIAALKKRGIHITFELYQSRIPYPDEIPRLPAALSWKNKKNYKALLFLSEPVMRNLEQFAEKLLNHVNPYTGLPWKEEPAIAGIGLVNEDPLWIQLNGCSADVRNMFEKAFEAEAKRRNRKVSGKNREQLYTRFLHEQYGKGFRRIAGFLRRLGVRPMITDLNYMNDLSTALSRRQFDYVDCHGYWAHPAFRNFKGGIYPAAFDNSSGIRSYGAFLSGNFAARHLGKPFAVSEWNHCFPNPYATEGPFLVGAYGALQDYGMICRFNYSWSALPIREKSKSKYVYFDLVNLPLPLLAERAGALLFLRGDVAPSGKEIPLYVNPECLTDPASPRSFPRAMECVGLIAKTGLIWEKPAPETPVLTLGKEPFGIRTEGRMETMESLREAGLISQSEFRKNEEIFQSSTGELTLNRKKGTFQALTSRSEAFVLPKDTAGYGKTAVIRNRRTFGSFLIASRDALPLMQSRRILILHLTSGYNSKMVYANAERNVILSPGKLPLLMARGEAEILLKLSGNYRLYACAFHGERLFEVPLKREKNGFSFTASNATKRGAVAVYELIRE